MIGCDLFHVSRSRELAVKLCLQTYTCGDQIWLKIGLDSCFISRYVRYLIKLPANFGLCSLRVKNDDCGRVELS